MSKEKAQPKPFPMSQEAFDRLAQKLGLTSKEAAKALLALGDTGEDDFHDNFAHEQAKLEASRLTVQEADLILILRHAALVSPNTDVSRVGFGNTVRIRFAGDDEPLELTILGSTDVSAGIPGRLSDASTLGQALLGATPGQEVSYQVQENFQTHSSTVKIEQILPGKFAPPREDQT